MTSLSHQAAEALKAYFEERGMRLGERSLQELALIIAKVTGCDEMAKAMADIAEQILESEEQQFAEKLAGNIVKEEFWKGQLRALRSVDALLSRLQPQAPTNRNPDA